MLSEEQYNQLKHTQNSQKERLTNLKMLFNLRPEVFDPEDQAEASRLLKNQRQVVYLAGLAFVGTSAIRIWQIKKEILTPKYGFISIVLCYLPAFAYYQYHSNKYQNFILGISDRYKERIRDDQLEQFNKQQADIVKQHKQG